MNDLAVCALMNLTASHQPGLTFSWHARGTAGWQPPAIGQGDPGSKVVTDSPATSQSPTPAASPSTSAPSWSGGRPGNFGRFGGFGVLGGLGGFGLGGFGGVIHGQFTEPKPGGGYQIVDVQRAR